MNRNPSIKIPTEKMATLTIIETILKTSKFFGLQTIKIENWQYLAFSSDFATFSKILKNLLCKCLPLKLNEENLILIDIENNEGEKEVCLRMLKGVKTQKNIYTLNRIQKKKKKKKLFK